AIKKEMIEIVIQINGRVRSRAQISADTGQSLIEEIVLKAPKIQNYINGAKIKKFVHVPGKLVNIIV
ncbi:MAG: hypothetical protein Q8Q33_00820, partial [Chlamydiota bacterium]|nr:hypothetical protein [Chlamydiota bacterium]